ncbi:MAG: single-stranded-DNA-specific exonuclease RecJ [Bdellovibrionales bacterium]|nr:single-stranded-DNA-specific exonuclease RecJ [Bdellovibrionales bacterium]
MMFEEEREKPSSNEEAEHLPEPPLPLPKLIWQVLYRRGFHSADAIKELYSPKLNTLSDPNQLKGMKRSTERLIQALVQNERVCLYADFDLDGTPGLALLKQGLEWMGFSNLEHYQPKRLSEGYGLHAHALKDFAERGVSLVVTVDVGITAIEEVELANELGIDVIITDHHQPKEALPNAHAIVNPNQPDCQSEMGYLCGAGVAYYLVLALRRELKNRKLLEEDFNPKHLLDCFAIATITDMVPLVNENRVLVKHGLLQLENTTRPGLRSLLDAVDLSGRRISSQDIGFRFAPKLNALSRMERGLLPIDLFLANTRELAESYVSEVLQNNEERVALQKKAEQESIEKTGASIDHGFVWVYSENFHKGVVGLVATKMAQKYGVPAFIGSVNTNGDIVGSARLPNSKGSVLEALEHGKEFLSGFGGHAPAAGFHLSLATAESFAEKLRDFFKTVDWSKMDPGDSESVPYEGVGFVEDLHGSFMSWYEGLGPFGIGFETPKFKVDQVVVKGFKWLSGGHLKLTLESRMQKARVDGLWFSPPKNHPIQGNHLEVGAHVHVVGEPQWNYFAGRKTLQLLLDDVVFVEHGV